MPDLGQQNIGRLESKFRSSGTLPQGYGAAHIVQGTIVNVNAKNWTVDVRAKFDRKLWPGVQIGSPYLHFNQGEGLYIMPELGAKCEVCLPSDGTQPFVICFIAPLESRGAEIKEAEDGTPELVSPDGAAKPNNVTASFAAGRYDAKPGDIVARTRDGNFLILHRGGVVQIGATSLCQRIFIPLENLMLDVSERYEHYNAGGSINWGLHPGDSEEDPTQFAQTFRVYAGDKFADLRIAAGKVYQPVGEKDGDETVAKLQELDIAQGEPTVFEVALAPDGFLASGEPSDKSVHQRTYLRLMFDRKGGFFGRIEGNAYLYCRKKLVIQSETLETKTKTWDMEVTNEWTGRGRSADLGFSVVKLGPDGSNRRPGARMGDPVALQLPPAVPVVGTLSGQPFVGTMTLVTPLIGSITGGNRRVLF
jgi:hypothetical protein